MPAHPFDAGALEAQIALEREYLREQISAAWQLQVDEALERLSGGWREVLERALEQRFSALTARLRESVLRLGDPSRLTGQLCQVARRLEQAADPVSWAAAVLDGIQAYASHVVLLEVFSGRVRLRDQRGFPPEWLPAPDWSVPVQAAPALAAAHSSLDTVVAVLGEQFPAEIAALFRQAGHLRVAVAPLVVGRLAGSARARAFLVAAQAGEILPVEGIELIAALAALALDRWEGTPAAPAAGLVGIAAAPPSPPPPSEGPAEEQMAHARAHRFARVRVAEIRLYRPEAVLTGREQKNLYAVLREAIDQGREAFRAEFGNIASMKDYFHLEVLRTLANEDVSLLGDEYPGPLF